MCGCIQQIFYPPPVVPSSALAVVGEGKMFFGAVAPTGWLLCHGQTLSVALFPALFAVIGNTHGGDGVTTFALPDMRDRFAIGASVSKPLGAKKESSSVTLTAGNLPQHAHTMTLGTGNNGGLVPAEGNYLTATASGNPAAAGIYTALPVNPVQSAPSSAVGAGEAIDITPAYVAVSYIIYAGV